jgi:DNA-binding SARP family transcriptional activator
MPRLRLITLGGFQIHRGDKSIVRLATRKAEALFGYLAIVERPVRRDVICALLWGDVPNAQARHSLRQTLTEIRASLRNGDIRLIVTVDDVIELDTRRLFVDVHVVERLLGRNTKESLRLACWLCRGDLLAGLDVKEAEFERWLTLERARVRQLAIQAHERYAESLLADAEVEKGIQTAMRLLALDPLHERAHRTLMVLYSRQGQFGAALRQYELCADILGHALNVEPSAETQQLRQQLIAERNLRT